MRSFVLIGAGVLLGLALSRSDVGSQLAALVEQGVHFMFG
jgi:hypothetical protein